MKGKKALAVKNTPMLPQTKPIQDIARVVSRVVLERSDTLNLDQTLLTQTWRKDLLGRDRPTSDGHRKKFHDG